VEVIVLAPDRQYRMSQYIKQRTSVTVNELSEFFQISTMTVRRDLERLEEAGQILRIHGGAMAVETPTGSREEMRATIQVSQKAAIGQAAARLVQDGQTIFVDAGTTTIELAKLLQDRRGLTLVTNSLRILTLLANSPGINVIGLGGSIYTGAWSFVGPIAEAALRRFHCDIAFLGIRNLSIERGLTENNYFEASVKSLIIKQSQNIVLLADSSKFERVSPVSVAPLADIDIIITDDQLRADLADAYRKTGVELILASPQNSPAQIDRNGQEAVPVQAHRSF
jgi:DeoR/GlpR family transcriptional regulator of sugar metabolism